MEYAYLGRTGLVVSRLIFGGAHLGAPDTVPRVPELVRAAWDAGITTFYTADEYHAGAAEQALGAAIRDRRDDCVLVIKAGYRVGGPRLPIVDGEHRAVQGLGTVDHGELWRRGIAPTSKGLSRKHLTAALEASLRRLGTDYIDVYSAHFWDPYTPVEETLSTMDGFVRQGKVRYLGCSQTQPWQLYRALWASDRLGLHRYEAVQARYSMVERSSTVDLPEAAEAAGVSVLAFNSLAAGLLTGRYRRGDPKPAASGAGGKHLDAYWRESTFDLLEELAAVAERLGRPIAELAQAWTLARPAVTALLVSPGRPAEFAGPVAAVGRPLTVDERTELDQVVPRWREEHR